MKRKVVSDVAPSNEKLQRLQKLVLEDKRNSAEYQSLLQEVVAEVNKRDPMIKEEGK